MSPANTSQTLDNQPESGQTVFAAGDRVEIALPLPVGGPDGRGYSWLVPPGMTLVPGDFVEVPFAARKVYGVVWGQGDRHVDAKKLKPVSLHLDCPPMTAALRDLIDFVSRYSLSPRGNVLRMAMSVPDALSPPEPRQALQLRIGAEPARMTDARRRVLQAATGKPPMSMAEIARLADVSPGVVKGLAEAGIFEQVTIADASLARPDPDRQGAVLTDAQRDAAQNVRDHVTHRRFRPILLDGVTGSGKTEVYFDVIADILRDGGQALVLLPEIALTAQWLDRFEDRFGAPPVMWHSDMPPRSRIRGWRAIATGEAQIVVGARSALFLPFQDLRLIVVDEEHDHSFKQEDGVCYQGRDMAVMRAQKSSCPVLLASATPSLETVVNVGAGRYDKIMLPSRFGKAVMPDLQLLDLREHKPEPQHWLGQPLVDAIDARLERGEQSMLFLNRRGYAPLTLCRHCGHRVKCPNCDAWLVEHRYFAKLQCHHCGFETGIMTDCPECKEPGQMATCGPGVERIAEEVERRWPTARYAVVSSDTMTTASKAEELVSAVTNGMVDILVGTQILAKGYHFPELTLVGVVDSDLGLEGGDLRAAERTWQMLSQVAGRAGRAEKPGTVMLQTYLPEHPLMQALISGARDRFMETERQERERHRMPPYGRLAAVIVSGKDADLVRKACAHLAREAPRHLDGVDILGPAPAPITLLRGRTRWRFLVRTDKAVRIQAVMADWIFRQNMPNSLRVTIDIDPYSFY